MTGDILSFLGGLSVLGYLVGVQKFYGAAAVGLILALHASILVRRHS